MYKVCGSTRLNVFLALISLVILSSSLSFAVERDRYPQNRNNESPTTEPTTEDSLQPEERRAYGYNSYPSNKHKYKKYTTTRYPEHVTPQNRVPPRISNQPECGKSKRDEDALSIKIVGGSLSSLGDWPWMAALLVSDNGGRTRSFTCGGSLIANRWILTAAHCITKSKRRTYYVRLGDLDYTTDDDGASPVDYQVEEAIPHAGYKKNPMVNDIALLKLMLPVEYTDNIQPICLLSGARYLPDSFYYNRKPYIVGWGSVTFNGPAVSYLQEAVIKIVNNTDCVKSYSPQEIDGRVLCAGAKGRDSCQGDSGGPLIFPDKKSYYLGGIVSFGAGCADPNYPGVYTRVAAFTDWIHQNTGLNDL